MPDPATTAAPEVPAAGSCRVPGWVVFGPGYHKGRLYTPADCRRMVENFARLSAGDSPYLKAKGKLGHDDQQRLANSLGYPACGRITGCRLAQDGRVEIDLDDVPLGIGSEINAGRLNDGSVEIDDAAPDPKDPAKTIPGPILTGVAFLGEEQPAVKGCPPPKAVLADQTVVPQGEKPAPWLADLFRNYMSAARPTTFSIGGRSVTRRVFRFSEVIPVRDQLLQTLAGMGIDTSDPAVAGMADDQLQALVNQLGGDSYAAKMKAKYAAPPVPPPAGTKNSDTPPDPDPNAAVMAAVQKCFGDFSAKFSGEFNSRMGAVEQAVGDLQKMKPDVQAAAKFSQDYHADQKARHKVVCERELDAAIEAGKVLPADRQVWLDSLLGKDASRKFSEAEDKANAGKTAFEVALAELHARKPTHFFSRDVPDATPQSGDDANDPFVKRALGATATGRRVVKALATGAAK